MMTKKEKDSTFYIGLARKYRVPMELFNSSNEHDQFRGVQFAFQRVVFTDFLAVNTPQEEVVTDLHESSFHGGDEWLHEVIDDIKPKTETLRRQFFLEIIELAEWLMKTYPLNFEVWRMAMLKRCIVPHIDRMSLSATVEKLALRITMFDELFYSSDADFYELAQRALVFPARKLRDNI